MTVKTRILGLFERSRELTVKEITDKLGASKQMIHNVLRQLVDDHVIEKLGRTPKTVYRVAQKKLSEDDPAYDVSDDKKEFLKKNFLAVTETGNLLEGIEAFDNWCKQRKLPLQKTISEFIQTKNKYSPYYDKSGNVNGLEKLKNTKGYDKIWLDDLCYLDFYAIERFGKTRLGTLLHYAKQ